MRALTQGISPAFLFSWTPSVSRGSLWWWNRGRRKSSLNNNMQVLWERQSRRLSKKPTYFIALRHYSFSWHIMFLIKIACELIKIFTQALFFSLFALVLCYSFSFLVKFTFILTLLSLPAATLAKSLYITKKKNLILRTHPKVTRGKGGGQR